MFDILYECPTKTLATNIEYGGVWGEEGWVFLCFPTVGSEILPSVTNVLLSGNTIAVTLEWEGDSSEEGDARVCLVQHAKEVSRLECARLLLLERGREAPSESRASISRGQEVSLILEASFVLFQCSNYHNASVHARHE